MARSIASGEPFFGYSVTKGRVLYLELDTPEQQLVERLKLLPQPSGVCYFACKLWIIRTPPTDEQLAWLDGLAHRIQPEVVFINTLRNCHTLPAKDDTTPPVVYSTYRTCFPNAALVFIHHQNKALRDHKGKIITDSFEDYTGSKVWENNAQVAVKLTEEMGSEPDTTYLRLNVFKSQVGPKIQSRYLLHADKATITRPELEIQRYTAEHPDASQREIAEAVGVSQSAVSRTLRREEE
jgi:predicted XRE-type DNA-binding protein